MQDNSDQITENIGKLSKMWWMWLVTGIIWVVLSLVILQFRESSVTTVGIIIGLMFFLAGIQNLFIGTIAEGWKWLWILFGVVFLIAGGVALISPKDTVAAFASVLGFLFLVFGVFWMVEAFFSRENNQLWWMGLIAGILMVFLAFWTGSQYLVTRVYTLLAFAGFWALMHGIMDITKAFQFKNIGKIAAL